MRIAASSLAALAGLHPYKSADVALVELWQKTAPASLQSAWTQHEHQQAAQQAEREDTAARSRTEAARAQQVAAAAAAAAARTPDAERTAQARTAAATAATAAAVANVSAQQAADSQMKPLSLPDVTGAKRKLAALEGAALDAGLAETLKVAETTLAAQGPDTPAQRREVERVLQQVKSEVYTAKGRRDETAALQVEERTTHRPIGRRNAEFFRHAMKTPDGTAFELCGYVDGVCDDHVVEVKNRMKRLFATIPTYEMVQMHAYMVLAGQKKCRWVQRFCQEQESRMVAWDGAWWDGQVLPPLYDAVARYQQLRGDADQQMALLAAVEGSWAPG
jgi:small-conductance mechanosensitive channel